MITLQNESYTRLGVHNESVLVLSIATCQRLCLKNKNCHDAQVQEGNDPQFESGGKLRLLWVCEYVYNIYYLYISKIQTYS